MFLDRDGVVVEEVGFVGTPTQLQVPGAVPNALKKLGERFVLIVVTNQSGIGRGFFTEPDLLEVHTALITILEDSGARVDCIYYCPHHPQAIVPEYRKACECRKPKAGMLLRAADSWNIDLARSFMVGDAITDMEAARSAGVTGIKISQGSAENRGPEPVVQSLEEAAALILGQIESRDSLAGEGVK